LNPAEQKALETMKKNPDDFFKDGKKPVRSDLEKIASDTTKSPETREAAQLLLDDPVIFGMLDNAKGHGGNLVKKGNDGAISKEDLYKVANNLNSENKAAPAKPVLSAAPATAADAQILQEMANGAADDPNIKKASGGGLVDFAKGALKVLSMVMEVAKGIADGITGLLPGPLKFIGAAISGGIAVVNDMGIKPGLAMLDGKTAEEAYIEGAKDLAMDAVATVASAVIPGGGAIVAAEAGVKAGATAGAKAAAEAGSKAAATSATRAGATAGAEAGAESATSAAVKEGVKTGVKDQATGAVQDKAVEAAMA
jgi:type III secretion translocon protein HrpF